MLLFFVKLLSHDQLFVTLWTVGHQVPLSMGFSRQEYWNGLLFPASGALPDPGVKPKSPTFGNGFFTTETPGKPIADPAAAKSLQSFPTLRDPMVCSPPGSSVHGIFQARILEWVAISFTKVSNWPRNWTHVFYVSWIVTYSLPTKLSEKPKEPLNEGEWREWKSWLETQHS